MLVAGIDRDVSHLIVCLVSSSSFSCNTMTSSTMTILSSGTHPEESATIIKESTFYIRTVDDLALPSSFNISNLECGISECSVPLRINGDCFYLILDGNPADVLIFVIKIRRSSILFTPQNILPVDVHQRQLSLTMNLIDMMPIDSISLLPSTLFPPRARMFVSLFLTDHFRYRW